MDKQREVFEVKNTFEIALDTVKGLGRFIEIEALKNFGDRNVTYNAIIAFSRKLGLNPKEQDQDGYVLMLLKKKRLIERAA